ncbi:MAG: RtcB family protein [Thermoanaerobacterium sp.]|nr:RtcB family protein [Thermoanaerobacterium sp.]
MAFQTINGVRVWGNPVENAVSQMETCSRVGNVVQTLLMADHHRGYSQPIGGVVVYDGQVSPSGVGYDIACGNKAVRTNVNYKDIEKNLSTIMNDIFSQLSFGVGRKNNEKVDHDLFDDPAWDVYKAIDRQEHDRLKTLARDQLGTIGSGNHFVDLLVDDDGYIWIANHFGSRGFGYKTATGFMNHSQGRGFSEKGRGEHMDQEPSLLDLNTELGQMYMEAMNLAGRYAYAGRDYVINKVLEILGAGEVTFEVHNHHNFAWEEEHNGKKVIVVRKGATPLRPGQLGFIGGSMGDFSVIVKGKDSQESRDAYFSTVHGAGRIMSRTEAAGKMNWKTKTRAGGKISEAQMHEALQDFGVILRGGGTDESPFVYRKLQEVLDAHSETMDVLFTLKPVGVCMAGADEFDPYKD